MPGVHRERHDSGTGPRGYQKDGPAGEAWEASGNRWNGEVSRYPYPDSFGAYLPSVNGCNYRGSILFLVPAHDSHGFVDTRMKFDLKYVILLVIYAVILLVQWRFEGCPR